MGSVSSGPWLGHQRTEGVDGDEAREADGDAPVCKGREAVFADEAEQVAHHKCPDDEGGGKADGNVERDGAVDEVAALVEVVAEGAHHDGQGDEEGELGGRALAGAEQHAAHHGGA